MRFCILSLRMIQLFSYLLSVKDLIDTFTVFSLFLGLKAIFRKCGNGGQSSLKGVLEAVCTLKSINLTINTIKILGVHFS